MRVLPIIFTYEDVKDLYPNPKNYYAYVNRACKRGELKKIKKGLYALVDPSTGYIYATKFQIASKLSKDSYFSYHDAIEYYGYATQVFVSRFTYISHSYARSLVFEDVEYCAVKNKCDLEIVDTIKENGSRVVSFERMLVDSIDNPGLAGGLEEVELVLASCPSPYTDVVIKLLEFYDKAVLYQKVGYLFEKYFGDELPQSFYDLCLSRIGKKTHYFGGKVRYSKFIKKWKLMVPKERDLPTELI